MNKLKTLIKHIVFMCRNGSNLKTVVFLFTSFLILKTSFLKNLSKKKIKIKFKINSKDTLLNMRIQDYFILYEVFGENIYKKIIDNPSKAYSILDLGAHVGFASLYFFHNIPNVSILSLEPTKESFSLLRSNTQGIENIKIINAAVSKDDGKVEIFIVPNGQAGNSINKKNSVENQQSEIVESFSLEHLLIDNPQIDTIKFDIEGSEYQVFKNSILPNSIKQIIGEIKVKNNQEYEDFLRLFPGFLIESEKMSNNMYIIYMKRY